MLAYAAEPREVFAQLSIAVLHVSERIPFIMNSKRLSSLLTHPTDLGEVVSITAITIKENGNTLGITSRH